MLLSCLISNCSQSKRSPEAGQQNKKFRTSSRPCLNRASVSCAGQRKFLVGERGTRRVGNPRCARVRCSGLDRVKARPNSELTQSIKKRPTKANVLPLLRSNFIARIALAYEAGGSEARASAGQQGRYIHACSQTKKKKSTPADWELERAFAATPIRPIKRTLSTTLARTMCRPVQVLVSSRPRGRPACAPTFGLFYFILLYFCCFFSFSFSFPFLFSFFFSFLCCFFSFFGSNLFSIFNILYNFFYVSLFLLKYIFWIDDHFLKRNIKCSYFKIGHF